MKFLLSFVLFLKFININFVLADQSSSCLDNYYYCEESDHCCSCDFDLVELFDCFTCFHTTFQTCYRNNNCPLGTQITSINDCSYKVACNEENCCCPCPSGSYNDEQGGRCKSCPSGTVSSFGSRSCSDSCPPGTGLDGTILQPEDAISTDFGFMTDSSNGLCAPCDNAWYNPGDSLYCSECHLPYSGTNGYVCLKCPLGTLSVYSSESEESYSPCGAFGFGLDPEKMSETITVVFAILMTIPILIVTYYKNLRTAFGTITYLALPTANGLLNIAYILEVPFRLRASIYTPVMTPVILLLVILWIYKATPCFILCPLPKSWYEDEYDSLMKLFPLGLLFFINLPLYILWFVFGLVLYMTKALAIGPLFSMWFRVWTGNNRINSIHVIDVQLLNFCITNQIFFEAIPLLSMQLSDESLVASINYEPSPLRFIALIVGFLSVGSGLYRIIYFKLYKHIDLLDIPLSGRFLCFELFPKDLDLRRIVTVEPNIRDDRYERDDYGLLSDKDRMHGSFKGTFLTCIQSTYHSIKLFMCTNYESFKTFLIWLNMKSTDSIHTSRTRSVKKRDPGYLYEMVSNEKTEKNMDDSHGLLSPSLSEPVEDIDDVAEMRAEIQRLRSEFALLKKDSNHNPSSTQSDSNNYKFNNTSSFYP